MKNNLRMKELILHEKLDTELLEMLSLEREKLHKMKMNHAVSPLENPNLISQTRKMIARIMTEISRRRLASKNI